MSDTVFLVVITAFMLAGEVALPGEVVEVTTAEARDLLDRGKARVATADDELSLEETDGEDGTFADEPDTQEPGGTHEPESPEAAAAVAPIAKVKK